MDAAEIDERIRRLEVRLGITEPAPWPDPDTFAAPQPWIEALAPTPPVVTAVENLDLLPPAAEEIVVLAGVDGGLPPLRRGAAG